jgi:hypothetical protein
MRLIDRREKETISAAPIVTLVKIASFCLTQFRTQNRVTLPGIAFRQAQSTGPWCRLEQNVK